MFKEEYIEYIFLNIMLEYIIAKIYYVLETFFCAALFWGFSNVIVKLFYIVSQILRILFIFFISFPLSIIQIEYFPRLIFKITDFFF